MERISRSGLLVAGGGGSYNVEYETLKTHGVPSLSFSLCLCLCLCLSLSLSLPIGLLYVCGSEENSHQLLQKVSSFTFHLNFKQSPYKFFIFLDSLVLVCPHSVRKATNDFFLNVVIRSWSTALTYCFGELWKTLGLEKRLDTITVA